MSAPYVLVVGVTEFAADHVARRLGLDPRRHVIRHAEHLRGHTAGVVLYLAGSAARWPWPRYVNEILELADLDDRIEVRTVPDPLTFRAPCVEDECREHAADELMPPRCRVHRVRFGWHPARRVR